MERNIDQLPLAHMTYWVLNPQPRHACVLTGSGTSDLLLCGMTPNQLSHTGQGEKINFLKYSFHHLEIYSDSVAFKLKI